MPLLKDFKYHAPTTLKEALACLNKAQAPLLLGGGTFVLNTLKKAARVPSDVIGLKKISVLCGIKDSKNSVVVGAMTTIAEIAESDVIKEYFLSLSHASSKLATTPIRHMATIGGNVASRFFWVDLPAVLMSLDAKLTYVTASSEKTVSIADFLTHKPAKKFIITKITLLKNDSTSFYFRHTKTMEADIPSCALAFSTSIQNGRLSCVRLVVNTALSFPIVLKETQDVLEGVLIREVSLEKSRQVLRKDLENSKLDEYRLGRLETDLESLFSFLKERIK